MQGQTSANGKRTQVAAGPKPRAAARPAKTRAIPDTQGRYMLLRKHDLEKDPDYQREPSPLRVASIAANWRWNACLALGVSRRNGVYYVFDGWHRVLAARQRNDIDHLPALVWNLESKADEAGAFDDVNNNRKSMSAYHKFKAACVAGKPDALAVKALIEGSGYKVTGGHDSGPIIRCIASVVRCYGESPETMTRLWPLYVALFAGEPMIRTIVEGLYYIERINTDGGDLSLTREPLRGRVLRAGVGPMRSEVERTRNYFGRGGEKIFAEGIARVINKNARTHIIHFPGMIGGGV